MKAKLKNKNEVIWKKFQEKWEKYHIWYDVVYLSFTDNLLYDYPIPEGCYVRERVVIILKGLKIPKQVKDKVEKTIRIPSGNACSGFTIENYACGDKTMFGSEWFCGHGTFYRWRENEKEKAEKRVDKWLTLAEKKCVSKIQKAIRLNLSKNFAKELDINKLIHEK